MAFNAIARYPHLYSFQGILDGMGTFISCQAYRNITDIHFNKLGERFFNNGDLFQRADFFQVVNQFLTGFPFPGNGH